MKKGFTMIELIFVIVILGILAAVAIPRLAATRDDAEISKAASNSATLVQDLGSYYTAQGEFGSWKTMTQVDVNGSTDITKTAAGTAELKLKGKKCVKYTAEINGTLVVEQGTDKTNNICKELYKVPEFADLGAGKKITHTFGGSGIKR